MGRLRQQLQHSQHESGVPLGAIERAARDLDPNVERVGDGLVRPNGSNPPTTLRVVPVDVACEDGQRLCDVVEIRTPLGGDLAKLDDDWITALNRCAALAAIVRDDATGRLEIRSRVSCYAGDDEGWRIYLPLAVHSFVHQFEAVRFAESSIRDGASAKAIAPQPLELSAWAGSQLTGALGFLRQRGWFANGDGDALAVEYPWDPGAITALQRLADPDRQGSRTSLLQLASGGRHAWLGAGLFARLWLPVQTDGPATGLAAYLNARESEALDAVPFFGAWTARPNHRHPSFVCFWPNSVWIPGSAINLAVWMKARSDWARRLLEGGADEGFVH